MSKNEVLKETTYDGITYICPTWEQMGNFTFSLATQILDSNCQFDRVVALAKGGWTWARTLVDYLQINKLSSTRLKSYDGVNQNGQVKVLQPLADSIDDEKILIFDDVIDSGNTVARAKEYMKLLGAKEISTAALCFKPRSIFTPEFYAFTTNSWVIFPHEYREFIEQSQKRWSSNNIPPGEVRTRLKDIGIPLDQVDYFLPR
jgi:uncharacterized protein